jgi:hypothetical protein
MRKPPNWQRQMSTLGRRFLRAVAKNLVIRPGGKPMNTDVSKSENSTWRLPQSWMPGIALGVAASALAVYALIYGASGQA